MNLRDQLQEQWAEAYQQHSGEGILHLCPRAGKIRTSIILLKKIAKQIGRTPKVLIAYPDKNIQKSWEDDIEAVKYKNDEVYYVTHVSLGKVDDKDYDVIICDEIHLLSENQKKNCLLKLKLTEDPLASFFSGAITVVYNSRKEGFPLLFFSNKLDVELNDRPPPDWFSSS